MSAVKTTIPYKVLILGPYKSGKTSILERYLLNKPPEDHGFTMGVKTSNKTVEKGGITVDISFWDLAGQDRTPVMSQQILRGSELVILVFDLSEPNYNELSKWKKGIDSNLEDVPVVLMGNKVDIICKNSKLVSIQNKEMKDFQRDNSKKNPINDIVMVSAKNEDGKLKAYLDRKVFEQIDAKIRTMSTRPTDDVNRLVNLQNNKKQKICCN